MFPIHMLNQILLCRRGNMTLLHMPLSMSYQALLRLPSILRLFTRSPFPTNQEKTISDDSLVVSCATLILGSIWSGWNQVQQVDSKLLLFLKRPMFSNVTFSLPAFFIVVCQSLYKSVSERFIGSLPCDCLLILASPVLQYCVVH